MFSCQHAAGSKDIFPAGCADRGHKSLIVKAGLEVLDYDIRRSLVWEIRNLMETDKIHPALQSFQHSYQSIRMSLGIVETGKHSVFETNSPLSGKIILAYQVYDILNRPCSLNRHDAETFRAEGVMKTL